MILGNLDGASAVKDQRVKLQIVEAVETVIRPLARALVLVKVCIVDLHLIIAALIASRILDTCGEALVIIVRPLRE